MKGSDTVLMVGHSHHASHDWLSTLLAIRLPLYPKLRVRLVTRFPMELVRGVLAGELGMALVTSPPRTRRSQPSHLPVLHSMPQFRRVIPSLPENT